MSDKPLKRCFSFSLAFVYETFSFRFPLFVSFPLESEGAQLLFSSDDGFEETPPSSRNNKLKSEPAGNLATAAETAGHRRSGATPVKMSHGLQNRRHAMTPEEGAPLTRSIGRWLLESPMCEFAVDAIYLVFAYES